MFASHLVCSCVENEVVRISELASGVVSCFLFPMRVRSFFALWLRELTINPVFPYSQRVAVVLQWYFFFLAVVLKETAYGAGGVTTYHKYGYALNLAEHKYSSTHDAILPWKRNKEG